jgi:hypothetical protein
VRVSCSEGPAVRAHSHRPGRQPEWLAAHDDLGGVEVAGWNAAELVARGDVELGEDLVQVVLDRSGADEQLCAYLRVGGPSRASRAMCASWGVRASRASTVRLRAVSPVARSSRRARSAQAGVLADAIAPWSRDPRCMTHALATLRAAHDALEPMIDGLPGPGGRRWVHEVLEDQRERGDQAWLARLWNS